MILDAFLQVSSAQQVTGTALSENSVDLGDVTPKRSIAAGEPMVFVLNVKANGTTTGSVVVQAIQSAAADLGSGTIVLGSIALATGDLTAGQTHILPIGQGPTRTRYIGLNYVVTGTVDATFDSFLQPASMAAVERPENYADGFAIL